MDRSQRRKGKLKKGLKRPATAFIRRPLGRPGQPELLVASPSEPEIDALVDSPHRTLHIFRQLLRFLQPTSKNMRIMHRDTERETLVEFIKRSFDVTIPLVNMKAHPSVMIVFGQAGLGKTLLLHDILEKLQDTLLCDFLGPEKKVKNKKRVAVYYYNSMNYDYPRRLLLCILKDIFRGDVEIDDQEDPDYYLQILRKRMKRVLRRKFIIIMIDELDHLYYKCPISFYSMIEFFNLSYVGFVKIGISNTLNFVSHVSGTFTLLNIKFLIFKPYTVAQLKDILVNRMAEATKDSDISWMELITPSTVELLVKKVISNNSSDVRFLLSCMSEVVTNKRCQLVETLGGQVEPLDVSPITPAEMVDLIRKKLDRKYAELVETFNFPQRLVLLAMCKLMKQESHLINKKEIRKLYKKLLKEYEVDYLIEFDVLLDNLVGYGFIKLFKDSTRAFVKSELSRSELVGYLSEVSEFERVFKNVIM